MAARLTSSRVQAQTHHGWPLGGYGSLQLMQHRRAEDHHDRINDRIRHYPHPEPYLQPTSTKRPPRVPRSSIFKTAVVLTLLSSMQPAMAGQLLSRVKGKSAPESTCESNEQESCAFDRAREFYQKGLQYVDKGKFRLAKTEFERAIEENPAYADAYYQLAVSYANLNDLQAAKTTVKEAIRLNPKVAAYYQMLGILSVQTNDVEQSEAAFRKSVEISEDDPYAWYNLGMVLERRENPEEAEIAYLNAITLKSGDKRFHQKLARLLEANGKLKRALLYYENLLQFDKNDGYAKEKVDEIKARLESQ